MIKRMSDGKSPTTTIVMTVMMMTMITMLASLVLQAPTTVDAFSILPYSSWHSRHGIKQVTSTTTGSYDPASSRGEGGVSTTTTTPTQLHMSSDSDAFPSAMPEKPQLTLEQRMQKSADDFLDSMFASLGPGVDAPPELAELRKMRQDTTTTSSDLALKIYELMIERGMRYDEATDGSGTLTPTDFNIQENLNVQEVKDEFGYLYKYGMKLMGRDLLTAAQVKRTVMDRLIKRTGLSPEEFDTWLGY